MREINNQIERQAKRQLQDLADQIGDKCGVVFVAKANREVDYSWYPDFVKGARDLAHWELDRLRARFEIPMETLIDLKVTEQGYLNAVACTDANSRFHISIDDGIARWAYSSIWGFLSNDIFKQLRKEKAYEGSKNVIVDFITECMVVCFHFTFLHEFMHISLGHFDYVNKNYQIHALYENEPNATPNPLLMQAMEIQADMCAFIQLMNIGAYHDLALGAGVSLFFDAFNYGRFELSDHSDKSHPHPLVRLMSLHSLCEGNREFSGRLEEFKRGSDMVLKSFIKYGDGMLFGKSNEGSPMTDPHQVGLAFIHSGRARSVRRSKQVSSSSQKRHLTIPQQIELALSEAKTMIGAADNLYLELSPISLFIHREIEARRHANALLAFDKEHLKDYPL